ncbi:amidohydrolase family protein [Sphingomicrobium lutaoense]|uniref:Imidazolonepropionase-like amidohydrolase n=1 Tax=Sphingomicrobium lutaoense TaxID=515949 RepID=A0A839Z4B7_9SPHN|nr:amidohydrolase family protein [Sphingomicrobium lutaoense]MBB3763474.1 imidazolonepropionase-like amidohydrolase [Sphingomicrobium lutaoense]
MKKLLIAAAALIAAPLSAQPVAITGGKLVVGDGSPPIENGVVVINDGRVVAVGGPGTTIPAGATIIAAPGKWITPGIVASFSRIGLVEVDGGVPGADDSDADDSPYSAALDIGWSVNPAASPVAVSRADGVTRAVIAPNAGEHIFAGRGAVIDTAADYDPITRPRAFQLVELGERGTSLAGGSRSAAYLTFTEALRAARDGRQPGGPDDSLWTDADLRALAPVVRGEEKLFVHVNRAVDIVNALKLRREFPRLDMVLVGVAEGWMVAREIAAAGVPVIAEPLLNRPDSFEQLAATQSNIGRMRKAGVDVSVSLITEWVSRGARNQRQYAGNLVALNRVPGHEGVSWDEAFAMITSRPAAMVGMAGEIGVLKRGARADVVVWSDDPLELSSAAEQVWIDGVQQSLETRQTRLRDRYRHIARQALPPSYRK